MARRKTYNPDTVREGAMMAFLHNGFGQTSLVELEQATGLNRRQLYNDFGDKHALFLGALDDFIALSVEMILHHLESDTAGVDAIEATLFTLVDMVETPDGRLGCMICNTSREPIVRDAAVGKVVQQFFRRIEKAYQKALDRAVQDGSLPKSTDTQSLARFFFGVHVALCVLSRAGESVDVLRDIASNSLTQLR